MCRYLIFAVLLLFVIPVSSQQISIEGGKTVSSFDFKNSQGESLENLQPTNHSYISLGYRKNIFTKNLYLNVDANYNNYGSIGSDRALDNFFEWDVNYLGLSAGLDYEVYKAGDFTFFIMGSAAVEFLIQGTQTLNNQVFDLTGEEDFKTPIYFFRAGAGAQYKISEKLSAFAQYTYGKSGTFKKIQGNLKIKAQNFGIGLLINIAQVPMGTSSVDSIQIALLQKDLESNSLRIRMLEEDTGQVEQLREELLLKEQEIRSMKESISNALFPYTGNELRIEEQQGKVKIIMENDMLFNSASWQITTEGQEAITALGEVLAKNPDMSIRIEGHTDDQPFSGRGNITNNWDLSLKRATTIVEILRANEAIDPKNLTAAGKGEYDPITSNDTAEGRAKNRRIEIVLTPKLEELIKLIKD